MAMRSDRFPFEILEIIFSDHSNIDIACKKEKPRNKRIDCNGTQHAASDISILLWCLNH